MPTALRSPSSDGEHRHFYAHTPITAPAPDDHGPTIRRWEMFSIAPDPPAPARDRLWNTIRDCDEFIPGITRCAVGTNMADSPVELVWETTTSPSARTRRRT